MKPERAVSQDLVLAIDFGTSNSLCAAADAKGVLAPIPLDENAPDPSILRSVIFTPERGRWIFGDTAIREYQAHFGHGRMFRSLKKYLPDPGFQGTQVHGAFVNLVDMCGQFLKHLRRKAEEFYGVSPTRVVLGRPALFSESEEEDALAQKRLESAAKFAGFQEVRFLAEPVAAAFEFRHTLTSPQNVLIADFGGGTSDFTVLRLSKEELHDEDVLAIGGVSIAGDRFDGSIMRHIIAPSFGSETVYRLPMGNNDLHLPRTLLSKLCSPADISFLAKKDIMGLLKDAQRWSLSADDAVKMQRLFVLVEEHLGYALFKAIEHTKIELSDATEALFRFDYPEAQVSERVTRKEFHRVSEELVEKIVTVMDETMARSGLGYKQIDVVCCTGGTAKIPTLRAALEHRLGPERLRQHRHFHSVVGGLAERGYVWARR